MTDKIVNIAAWHKNKASTVKSPKIYLSKTRQKGYCNLVFLDENGKNSIYELDFRYGNVAERELVTVLDFNSWLEIDYQTAMSLLKEAYDKMLRKDGKLKAKEAAFYDKITNYLLHNDNQTLKLPVHSLDWQETIDALKEILLYNDFGLLYELADEKLKKKAENKYTFIHQQNLIGEGNSVLSDTINFAEPHTLVNELNEEVSAVLARWEINTAEQVHCEVLAYFELILKPEGYWLNRFCLLDTYKLSFKEEYYGKSYLEKYYLPDGRWLIKPLNDDENLILSGEKEYYQIYEFLLAKQNSSAKIILSAKEMWLCADNKDKLVKLREYLNTKIIADMAGLFLTEKEMNIVELVQELLKFNIKE